MMGNDDRLSLLREWSDDEVGLSAVTVMQLTQGLLTLDEAQIPATRKADIRRRAELLLSVMPVVALDAAAAQEAAKLKCCRCPTGERLTDAAASIAGQAVSGQLTLITKDGQKWATLGCPSLKWMDWR